MPMSGSKSNVGVTNDTSERYNLSVSSRRNSPFGGIEVLDAWHLSHRADERSVNPPFCANENARRLDMKSTFRMRSGFVVRTRPASEGVVLVRRAARGQPVGRISAA